MMRWGAELRRDHDRQGERCEDARIHDRCPVDGAGDGHGSNGAGDRLKVDAGGLVAPHLAWHQRLVGRAALLWVAVLDQRDRAVVALDLPPAWVGRKGW